MSDDTYEQFLGKGSPFLFAPGTRLKAVTNFSNAKHPQRLIAEYILSCVDAQKNALLTKHMALISKKFGTTSENLNEYEDGITMPLQLVLGTIYYLSKDNTGLHAQIDHISKDCCCDYFQFYEASLPKCCSIVYQKRPLHDVLSYARKYRPDLYYQVGARVAGGTFLDIVKTIHIFQISPKH